MDTFMSRLKIGMEVKKDYQVERSDTARFTGSGGLEVLATPVLMSWLENACYELTGLCLPDHESTVGVRMILDHIAATPVGMKVRIKVVLKEIDQRRIVFSVEAWDKVQRICFGEHERFIVEKTSFMTKVLKKRDGE